MHVPASICKFLLSSTAGKLRREFLYLTLRWAPLIRLFYQPEYLLGMFFPPSIKPLLRFSESQVVIPELPLGIKFFDGEYSIWSIHNYLANSIAEELCCIQIARVACFDGLYDGDKYCEIVAMLFVALQILCFQ